MMIGINLKRSLKSYLSTQVVAFPVFAKALFKEDIGLFFCFFVDYRWRQRC